MKSKYNYKEFFSDLLSEVDYIEDAVAPDLLFRPDYVIHHDGKNIFLCFLLLSTLNFFGNLGRYTNLFRNN